MTSVELKDALGAAIEEHGLNSNGVVVTTCLLDDGRLLLEVEGEADGQKLANGRLFPPTGICFDCALLTMMGLIDSVREAMCSTKTAPS